MLAKEDYGKPPQAPLGSYPGSYNVCSMYDKFYGNSFYLQGPIMKTFRRRLLEMEVELVIHRKTAEDFEEEKLINHVLYATKELVEFLEKRDGSSGS